MASKWRHWRNTGLSASVGSSPEGPELFFAYYLKGLLKWWILHNNGFFFLAGSEHPLTWRTSLQTQHSLLVKTKPDMERCYEQRRTVLPCRKRRGGRPSRRCHFQRIWPQMSSAAHRFYIILFLIVRLEEGGEISALQSKFLTSLHKHFDFKLLGFLFFFPPLCSFLSVCAHVSEHVRKRYHTVCSGGNDQPPPPPPWAVLLTWHIRDFIAFWIHSCSTCCSANNLRRLKWATDERLRSQMWRVGVKKRLCRRLYRVETLSI